MAVIADMVSKLCVYNTSRVFGKAYTKIESERPPSEGSILTRKSLGTEKITRCIIFLVGDVIYSNPAFLEKRPNIAPCLHLIGSFPHRLAAILPDNHDTDSRVWPPLR